MPLGADSHPKLVLDTSAYSRMRHGHTSVLDMIAAAETVLLPLIVVGELEAGFELGQRARENRRMIQEFMAEPFVSLLPVTRAVALAYGRLFAQLRQAGTPIPTNDVWIAATALDAGGHLITFDEHFRSVRALSTTILA